MTATIRYLDALARKLGGVSDYRLGKVLDLSHGAISRYRTGVGGFENRIAFRVAELLELSPADVIAEVERDRAKTEKDRAFWAARAAGKAAGFFLAASILLAFEAAGEAHASTLSDDFAQCNKNIHYKFLRQIWAWIKVNISYAFWPVPPQLTRP